LKRGENDRGLEHWCILYLDGIHFSIRHGDKTDSTMILTADGALIWPETKRCWRGSACPEESKDGWVCEARKTCEGEAPSRLISLELPVMMDCWLRSRHSLRPRLVNAGESHKRRNVLNAIPRRERGEVQAELDGIWSQPVLSLSVVDNSFSPHRLTILLDPAYSIF
jgi:putative transposase